MTGPSPPHHLHSCLHPPPPAGYSGSDLAALCKEAAMLPIRELDARAVATVPVDALRPMTPADFAAALRAIRPSVSPSQLTKYERWTAEFGS